ncbi:MAG: tetratricopeptide repeat protein, partial [Phycisphaerae bacterium]|nr:tetratricopeptide repeat protein [Phycisphaerae bacterium]
TAYLAQGRIAEAIDVLRKACKLDPESTIAHRRLAYAYSKLGRYGAALEEFEVALRISPDDFQCRNSMAAVLMIFFLKNQTKDELRQQAVHNWHLSLETNADQSSIKRLVKKWGSFKPKLEPLPAIVPVRPEPKRPAHPDSPEPTFEALPDIGGPDEPGEEASDPEPAEDIK